MADVLISFEGRVERDGGSTFAVQACGRPLRDNLWEGWLEFLPDDGSKVLRTQRETTQPNREDLEYWASGLELVYLEGALQRALASEHLVELAPPVTASTPVYEGPEPEVPHTHARPAAALDPFRIHASQGDDVLLRQLAALELWQLRAVALAHTDTTELAADEMDRHELTQTILKAVRS